MPNAMRNKLTKITHILPILLIGAIGVQTMVSCSSGGGDGGNSSLAGEPITFYPVLGDSNSIKPMWDIDIWFTGNPTDQGCNACPRLPISGPFPSINMIWDPVEEAMVSVPTNTTVHGFGKKGTPIPPQRAGELILTALPNASGTVNGMSYADWRKDEKSQKLFGLPPTVAEMNGIKMPYGVADPKGQAMDGGYVFVKNGFPNESSAGGVGHFAPTRCVADRTKSDEPRINCLNFSMLEEQPFEITVTVYNQKGKLITQYHETVTEREFRSVVQGPNYVPDEKANVAKVGENSSTDCQKPTSSNYGQPNVLTTNGLVNANVNIYPFSTGGNLWGDGTYTAKIDRVDLPYGGCINNEGMPTYINRDYMHHHAELKFEWIWGEYKK